MVESLALGLVYVGALMMVAAAVFANVVFFRYPVKRRLSTHDPVSRRETDMTFAISLLQCAAVTFGGACVLVLGLVVGSGAAAWTLLIPFVPLAVVAVSVVYLKRLSL
ncbi:MAG TPA: hypothetical protein VK256_08120 [Candidatus Eisenbacteria bacterium]|nr:hypothetical protein [Candidatus Eisenbacteria bacterium]